jgi:hypothetical protein
MANLASVKFSKRLHVGTRGKRYSRMGPFPTRLAQGS